MVGALNLLGEAARMLLAEAGAAVATHVVIGTNGARLISQYDDAFTAYLLQYVITGVRNPVLTTHTQPTAREYLLAFFGEDLRRYVIASWQRTGSLDRDLSRLQKLCHGWPQYY